MVEQRIGRTDLFVAVAHLFGLRSTCPRAKVGAVAVLEGRIVSTGYVGAPSELPHCTEVDCDLQMVGERERCVRTVHAEANVISWAAREGTPLEDAILYCTHMPCYSCAKLIVNAGIQRVVFENPYDDPDTLRLFRQLEIEVTRYVADTRSEVPVEEDS